MFIKKKTTYKLGVNALARLLDKHLRRVCSYRLNKLIITKKNKPVAVMIPIEEYESIRDAAEYLENMSISKTMTNKGDFKNE